MKRDISTRGHRATQCRNMPGNGVLFFDCRYTMSWAPPGDRGDEIYNKVVNEAKALLKEFNSTKHLDGLNFAALDALNWTEALEAMSQAGGIGMTAQVLNESSEIARVRVYKGLQLNPSEPGGLLPCPEGSYFQAAQATSSRQIVLGGYRLSFVLRQIATQARAKGLVDDGWQIATQTV